MAAFGWLILTNKGRALQAKVQAGAPLHFNRIGVGDGNLGSSQISDLNVLISEKKSLAINKLKTQSGGKAIIGGVLSNQAVVTGFYFREIGYFAQDPDVGEILYCYANSGAGAEYIPPGGGPDVVEKQIDTIILTANAPTVTADISSGLYAAAADFDAHTSDQAAHGATSAATANKIVQRDANGRFKAAAPAAADDVVIKSTLDAAIAALINGAPGALDTLIELANALGSDPNFATTMTNALAAKAPLASPAFTGNPTAPTPAPGDNDTSIATTAFVAAAVAAVPSPGAATSAARGTVRVAANPATGDPVSSTRVASASEVNLATTVETSIASYNPTAAGNFLIWVYLRVVTGTTTVTVKVTYADATGAQTTFIINAQVTAIGSYSLLPLFINAVAGTLIDVRVTASVANQVKASASILGV